MQIQPPTSFSASLQLDGLPVLVCGGGPAALSAIRRLLDSGAVVTVVAPEIGATVADLATRGLLIIRRRPPAPDDFTGAALVVPATGVAERDQAIAAAAEDEGVAAFETDDRLAARGVLDQELVDPLLGRGCASRDLGNLDDQYFRLCVLQRRQRS